MDVIQEVEYVKQEAKMVYLLECLQKTPPPVIIFSDNKNEVDGELSIAVSLTNPLTQGDRYTRVLASERCRGSGHPR